MNQDFDTDFILEKALRSESSLHFTMKESERSKTMLKVTKQRKAGQHQAPVSSQPELKGHVLSSTRCWHSV